MTTRFTMTHEFNCSVDTFWDKVMFDKGMNEALFKGALGFPEYELVEQRETDAEVYRKTISTPKLNVPGPIQKLLGSNFRLTEELTFDRKSRVAKFKGIPSTLADKITNEGSIRLDAAGTGRCRRTVEVLVEARVSFVVNGLLESTTEKNVRDAYDRGAVFINKWIAEKSLAGT